MISPLRLPGFVLLCLLAGCVSPGRALPLDAVVPPGTAGFALDPIPTPARAELSEEVLPMDPGTTDEVIADLPGAGPDAYELSVSDDDGRTRIRIAAAGPAGRRDARATLDQLVAAKDGRRYVREGRIEDAPAMPLRGSKRPLPFEWRYHANLTWQANRLAPKLAALGRTEFVPVLSPGKVLDATEVGIARARAFFRAGRAAGAHRFAIEFDDVGFGLTEATRDRFGTYPRALVHYLRECRKSLKAIEPGAVLYWLPQTYWTNDPRLPTFAHDIGRAGGLPPDLGLVLTGPEIVSRTIRVSDVERARRAFGLTRTKALIYDNLGREGDHGPLTGRDPALATCVDGVFGERGEVLNRITRLDYNWNPLAYDPARSHLLACRELAGAAAAPALSRLIRDGRRLTPRERAVLVREVKAKLDPPSRAPPGARAIVDRILRGTSTSP